MSKNYSKNLYKPKAKPKAEKPKAKPKESMFAFTPYIDNVFNGVTQCKAWLEEMKAGWNPNPANFGLKTIEEVYNKTVYNANYYIFVYNNWKKMVENSVPVSVADDKNRQVVDLNDESCYWHEPDLANMYPGEYNNRIVENQGKWRNILELRGALLVGEEYQISVLQTIYRIVATQYTYYHGFRIYDELGIVPHENWREKMGSIYRNKINILK